MFAETNPCRLLFSGFLYGDNACSSLRQICINYSWLPPSATSETFQLSSFFYFKSTIKAAILSLFLYNLPLSWLTAWTIRFDFLSHKQNVLTFITTHIQYALQWWRKMCLCCHGGGSFFHLQIAVSAVQVNWWLYTEGTDKTKTAKLILNFSPPLTLKELWTSVSSKSITTHFFP